MDCEVNIPTANPKATRHVRAKQAFQRLWVAGTLGAFFTSLARTIPIDVRKLKDSFSPDEALNTLLRYAYMIWLIWYFFLSNLRSQSERLPKTNEIRYDVIQSIFALTAAFYLDFLVANEHHGINAFAFANLAIAVICGFAWFWFKPNTQLQPVRFLGTLVSLASALSVWILPMWWSERAVRRLLFVSVAILGIALAIFHIVRLKDLDPSDLERLSVPTESPEVPSK
jgi:hypothetical protein